MTHPQKKTLIKYLCKRNKKSPNKNTEDDSDLTDVGRW